MYCRQQTTLHTTHTHRRTCYELIKKKFPSQTLLLSIIIRYDDDFHYHISSDQLDSLCPFGYNNNNKKNFLFTRKSKVSTKKNENLLHNDIFFRFVVVVVSKCFIFFFCQFFFIHSFISYEIHSFIHSSCQFLYDNDDSDTVIYSIVSLLLFVNNDGIWLLPVNDIIINESQVNFLFSSSNTKQK
ncbi:hypothetical protein DERF_014916 [Dermatophagoides farinae]|uniref:Transmembrane protein n=1 Tax=Dermatophagoides farinae TaxID=6954 RepID=A0A922HNV8_DERFA|nr:hypothetical protein DERF_014916 [Dermatophagoides farinae]